MSSADSGRAFSTNIVGVEGSWPDPPARWSFSSLSEIEACPRRWALSRASYPGLWDKPGYPEYAYVGTVVGHVVHASLEIILGELVRAGCSSVEDPSAVTALRSVGGYTQLLRDQVKAQVRRLADNPRSSGRLDQIERDLLTRVPEMRQSVQALVARSEFTSGSEFVASSGSTGARLADGTYTEFEIRSEELAFSGRIDLLVVAGREIRVTDFKSGAPSAEHEDQLRTYAAVWARRTDPDPDQPLATRLTIAYVTHDVDIDAPGHEEIDQIAQRLRDRVDAATNELKSADPIAKPGVDTCRYCSVRHLCEDYWRMLDQSDPEGVGDVEVEIVAPNGPRSWLVRTSAGAGGILRTSERDDLSAGARRRFLGVFVSPADNDGMFTISVGHSSEEYALREADGDRR